MQVRSRGLKVEQGAKEARAWHPLACGAAMRGSCEQAFRVERSGCEQWFRVQAVSRPRSRCMASGEEWTRLDRLLGRDP